MRTLFYLILLISTVSCSNDDLFNDESRQDYWLQHKGADLPIIVEGNTNSKTFVLLLHGGPGGTAQEFNASLQPFTDILEAQYAMVYYDQRNAGLARGEWDEEKLTIEQHVEDLDKVIDFLYFQYGSDSKIILTGHSWGGYLGTAYILNPERQNKVKVWININGLIHRNLKTGHTLERIIAIANEQIAKNKSTEAWAELKENAQSELDKGIILNDEVTESEPNSLAVQAENQIDRDRELVYNRSSVGSSLYRDNYDLFLFFANDRKGSLIEQMYIYDEIIDASLSNITIPVLNIYGKYDFRTPIKQGEYLLNGISTSLLDKKLVVLEKSGHSSPGNEHEAVANEILDWIGQYK